MEIGRLFTDATQSVDCTREILRFLGPVEFKSVSKVNRFLNEICKDNEMNALITYKNLHANNKFHVERAKFNTSSSSMQYQALENNSTMFTQSDKLLFIHWLGDCIVLDKSNFGLVTRIKGSDIFK